MSAVRTVDAPQHAPAGLLRSGRVRAVVPVLGPSFVAAIAYIDPGNFATDLVAGSGFGLQLVAVVAAASLLGMVVQTLAARVGIASDRDLAELAGAHLARVPRLSLWLVGEAAAMTTDVAELVGAGLALMLLFGISAQSAAAVTAAASLALLAVRRAGARPFEAMFAATLALVAALIGVLALVAHAHGGAPGWQQGSGVPGMTPALAAAGIVGATIMPHAVFLQSGLTARRIAFQSDAERAAALRATRVDVITALGFAGAVNVGMLVVAALVFAGHGSAVTTLEGAFSSLSSTSGNEAAKIFGIALLASGLASAAVGTMSGQIVMGGLLQRSPPMLLRRLVTIAPAVIVLASGASPTTALVLTQVVLSFLLPPVLVALIWAASSRRLMGSYRCSWRLAAVAGVVTAVVTVLNCWVLIQAL